MTKVMTCRQLGGPCDHEHSGNTADEIIRAQDEHLKQQVAAGDETHRSARDDMKSRWRRPVSGMRWYKQAKHDFAELPEHE